MSEAAEVTEAPEAIVEEMGFEAPQGDEDEAPPDAGAETEGESEVAAEPASRPEKPAHKQFVDEALFTEEALKSPEGIGKARDVLLAKQVHMNRAWGRLETRQAKVASREQSVHQRETAIIKLADGLTSDLQLLENGDATAIINTLGKLTRRDGVAVYEMLTQGMVANGKRPKPSAETQELRNEIAQLRKELGDKARAEADASVRARELQARQRIHAGAANAERYPALAHFLGKKPAEVVETLVQMKLDHHAAHGTVLDDAEAFRTLDGQLRQYVATGPSPDAGRATSGTKPGTQAARPGRTISPTRASTASSRRSVDEMSDEERFAELARDPADLFDQLGL